MFREDRLKGERRLAKDKMITHGQNPEAQKLRGRRHRESVVSFVSVSKAVVPLRICEYPRCMDAEFRGGQNVAVIFRDILVPTAVDRMAGDIPNAPTKFGGVFEYSLWTEKPYFLESPFVGRI